MRIPNQTKSRGPGPKARLSAWLGGAAVTLLGTSVFAGTVQINEVQSANDRTLFDEEGAASDWIELWNPGDTSFDLGGCWLSDDAKTPLKWRFAPGTVLSSNEFLVVFASGKDRQPELAPLLTPSQVAGLQVWLRADAVNASDPEQVRTTGNSTFVRQWVDGSGHTNHAAQSVETLQPRWVAGGSNGFPSIHFDGADDLLRLSHPVGTNNFCVFTVCRTTQMHEIDSETTSGVGGVNGQHWLFGASHGGDLDSGAGVSLGTNGISVYEHGSGYMPALLAYQRPIGSDLQVVAINYTAKQPSLDLQGLAVRTGLTSPRHDVWAPVEIGAGAYGAFAGDMLEVLVFDRALSVDERRGIARYLAGRYAVRLQLPRHTNFQLSAKGEEVVLTAADGVQLDRMIFGAIPRDISFGRPASDPASLLFFSIPTPSAANTYPGTSEWLFQPILSATGGFYTNAFKLALTSPGVGVEIRFTLNGSEPTTNSPLYTAPISINSRAGTANFLSAIPTVPGGQPPSEEVFKGWVVRARAFKAGAMPSPIATATYWIHPKGAARYSLPVVALTTERRDFFDPEVGIYIPGNAPGGNYSQRGPEWERPINVEFYETNGILAFGQQGSVKIHGNTSQGFPIKGLDLDSTGVSTSQPFRHRIFPNRARTEFQHFLLRPSGQDQTIAFMRDELMQAIGGETGAESQAARPCIVFLNGEYWGLHYLKEKEDAEFVSFYGNTPSNAMDFVEGYAAAREGDTRHYDAMVQLIATGDPSLDQNYQAIQALMEVPNYLDYKICEIFNYRWDIGNHRLWRPRTPEGRWRWLQFDNDVGWGGFWAEQPAWSYDMLSADLSTDGRLHGHNNEATTFLLRRLILNTQFREDFINRFADLLNTTFLPTNTVPHVDRHAAQLAPEMDEHCKRWHTPASPADWQQAVAYLRQFAQLRPEFCREHLINQFNLAGTAQLSIQASPYNGGTVRLNSLDLALKENDPWKGTYFRGNAIAVSAQPRPGYRFVGWTGLPGTTTNRLRFMLQGDWAITARFEHEQTTPPKLSARIDATSGLLISIVADPGSSWMFQASTNLHDWSSPATVLIGPSGQTFVTNRLGSNNTQFLRARSP